MSSKRVRIYYLHLNSCITLFWYSICIFLNFSISASSGKSCTGILGDSIASIGAPTAIGGIGLVGKKDTAYRCRDFEMELNEKEDPRK